jgi:hypothetical protein
MLGSLFARTVIFSRDVVSVDSSRIGDQNQGIVYVVALF